MTNQFVMELNWVRAKCILELPERSVALAGPRRGMTLFTVAGELKAGWFLDFAFWTVWSSQVMAQLKLCISKPADVSS